ncbi:MAG: hypothetical protein JW822_07065 [Spirochaetales bacterium]|nr:hypothetical protein [Spirochaetales bacterium]
MIFSVFFISPYPWLFIAAIFTGAALNKLMRSTKKAKDPVRAKESKRALIMLFLVCGFITLLCSLFVPGLDKFVKDPVALLFFFLIMSGIFFLALRFKRLFGIPFAVLFILLIVTAVLFLQAIVAFTGETEIARVRVDAVKDGIIKYELTLATGEKELVVTEGVNFAPEAKLIIFDDFLVFFGAKTWYRFDAMLHYDPAKSSATEVTFNRHPIKRPQGITEAVYNFVLENQEIIPGIKTLQGQITYPISVREGSTYIITVQNDGGVEIRER